ncbi:PLP-dependent aminotransferase family protein [Sphingomonas cavernae]|uniref:PLP-dependent aminotransferase family protein n=1 Tax=Sphingomonas cavernae TaxID=2320861 RepID=A0A418W771_9SPHN|nr:PLP-dependent aminotransferase family protein [Sphingomonas cavernae]RJF85859.1 PLP-dependent aminotransferase family protein [Sphingomonas cavernae]
MQTWLPTLDGTRGPKYLAIADAIDQAVRTGVLRAGERLPPQRELAKALGVDLTTVTRAYALVREAGVIEASGRLGSYVRNSAANLIAESVSDSGMIMPPQPPFALLPEAMRTGLTRLLRAGGQSPLLQYQPAGGNIHDRKAAAAALTARGIASSEDEVVIAAGGQNALHAILSTASKSGDIICAGSCTYPGLLALANSLGLRLVPLPCDHEGVDPQALANAARAGARALYVVPTNDNPTTATMGKGRRRAIAAAAQEHGLMIIEDDAYGQLPSRPFPALASFAPERTWHIASMSKIISPVLRIAHVRAPSGQDAWNLAAFIHETAVMGPPLNAALVTSWLKDGTFGDLVGAVRQEGIARQRIVARVLDGMDYATHAEGYHIWLKLADGLSAAELASMVRLAGLSIVPGEAFAVDRAAAPSAVRISIGGALDHERLRIALERLRILLPAQATRRSLLV